MSTEACLEASQRGHPFCFGLDPIVVLVIDVFAVFIPADAFKFEFPCVFQNRRGCAFIQVYWLDLSLFLLFCGKV